MELRFAFLVSIRRDRYIVDEDSKKKFQGGFDYSVPMDCNWSLGNLGRSFAAHILGVCMTKWNSNTTMGGKLGGS